MIETNLIIWPARSCANLSVSQEMTVAIVGKKECQIDKVKMREEVSLKVKAIKEESEKE